MDITTVIPAYGRDYKTSEAALSDWKEGKDFLIQSITHPYDGMYCSIRDKIEVSIRFNNLRDIVIPSHFKKR